MKITSEVDNIRIDKYLASITELSRSFITKLIDDKKVMVNNILVKPSFLLSIGDIIDYDDHYEVVNDIEPEDIKLDIVYEDDYLMVINKPSGMVVHPGSGNETHTLVTALLNYTNNLSDIDEIRPGIVHRIDKDTSGLMIVAKTNKCHQLLTEMLSKKEIHRDYLALLKGEFKYDTADIDAPIGRDEKNRQRMTVTPNNSKNAITHLKVVKRYISYTLVRLSLETGRTHQIRVHMNYIGYPIFNDPVYTNDKCSEFGQFLHSYYLEFIHPITKKKLEFTCKLPDYFTNYLDTLEEVK